MSPKTLLYLFTILSFFYFFSSPISALTIPTANSTDKNAVHTPNTTSTCPSHRQQSHQRDAAYYHATDIIPQRESVPPSTTSKQHTSADLATKSTSTTIQNTKLTPRTRTRTHHATSESQAGNATAIDENKSGEEVEWFNAEWVTVATWALWLWIIAAALGLLALWGRGVIDHFGDWVTVGGGREDGQRRGLDEGRLRRVGVF